VSASAGGGGRCRRGLLKGEHRFFEAQAFAAQEPPDRIMGDGDPAFRQFRLQAMQRQMRILLQPLDDQGPVRLQHVFAVSAHLTGRHRAGGAMALRPLHHGGDRNPEPGRHHPARLAGQDRRDDAFAQIIGERSDHKMLASAQPAS